jgi:hypothetical protein
MQSLRRHMLLSEFQGFPPDPTMLQHLLQLDSNLVYRQDIELPAVWHRLPRPHILPTFFRTLQRAPQSTLCSLGAV